MSTASTSTSAGIPTDLSPLDSSSKIALTHALRRDAATEHANHPQYDGYFEDWTLHIVTRPTRFKSSDVLPLGRIVLACSDLTIEPGIPVTRKAYHPTTGHVVAVPHENIRSL